MHIKILAGGIPPAIFFEFSMVGILSQLRPEICESVYYGFMPKSIIGYK